MKKALILFFTTIIVMSGLSKYNYSYGDEIHINAPLSKGEKVIQTFAYKDLDNLSKRINVIAKNAIETKKNPDLEKIKESVRDVDSVLSDISYLLTEIRIEYDNYKDDLSISNGMLSMGAIATDFRIATVQLKEYLLSNNIEDEYRTIGNFFKMMSDGERSLSNVKSYIPKP